MKAQATMKVMLSCKPHKARGPAIILRCILVVLKDMATDRLSKIRGHHIKRGARHDRTLNGVYEIVAWARQGPTTTEQRSY